MCKSRPVNTQGQQNPNSTINQSNIVKPIQPTHPTFTPTINPNTNTLTTTTNNIYQSGLGNSLVPVLANAGSSKIVKPGQIKQQSITSPLIGGNTNAPIDQKLQKSQVHVKQLNDPTIRNFFKDCVTQRVELTKVSYQHNSFVKQQDYFDISNGHYIELNAIKPTADTKMAQYGVSEASTLTTPSINKFIYNQNIIDVNYEPKNQVYRNNYQLVSQNSLNNQYAHSTVQPVYVNNQNQTVVPGLDINHSTVKPYADTANLVYSNRGQSVAYQQPASSQINGVGHQQSLASQPYNPVGQLIRGSEGYNISGANQTITTPPIASSLSRQVRDATLTESRQNSLGLL